MSVFRLLQSALQKSFLLLMISLLAVSGVAQDATPPPATTSTPTLTPLPQAPAPAKNAHPYSADDYSRSKGPFFNFVAPYTARDVPPPNLTNSARIDQLVKEGKLYLSVNDAIAMALENNLDITLQRYNLSIADTDVLRVRAGGINGFARGVNAGVLQGTPGGAVGSTSAGGTGSTGAQGTGAGSTQLGAGGAGAGAAGIVASTLGSGPVIDNYDPLLTGTLGGEHSTTPEANTIFTGTPTLVQNTYNYNFQWTQGFHTGTLATVGFNNNRVTSNAVFNQLSPYISSGFRFTLRQHLLQGFGFDPNLRWIRIAQNNREITDVVFRQQIIQTVSQIANIYCDLVTAYEAVKVNERALQLAKKTLSDNEEQVRIGTLAPITLAQARSGVATGEQNLVVSQTNLQLEQLLMKNAITKNMSDPILAVAEVVPTDTMQLTGQYEVRPVEELIQEALQARPEIAVQRINLTNLEITRKSLKNGLKPSLDLYAFYGASGLAGEQNPAFTCSGGNTMNCLPPGSIPRSGYPNAFADLFNSSAPDKGIGVNLNITIRNRQAQADQVRSDLEYRQAQVALQQQENFITLQVRQAQFALQQNHAALQAAIAARDYAQESLTAEEKKFSYGASTPTLVLQASSNLTQSESNLLNAAANYEKSKIELDRVTADTLIRLGVDVGDAEAGQVRRMPEVKGVVPRGSPGDVLEHSGTQPAPQPQQ